MNTRNSTDRNHRVVSEAQIVEKREGGIPERGAQRGVGKQRPVDQLAQKGNERVEGKLHSGGDSVLRDDVKDLESSEQVRKRKMEKTVGEMEKNVLVKKTLCDKEKGKRPRIARGVETTRRERGVWRDSALRSLDSLSQRGATRGGGELKPLDETPRLTLGCGFHWK